MLCLSSSRQALISYQDDHMSLLAIAGTLRGKGMSGAACGGTGDFAGAPAVLRGVRYSVDVETCAWYLDADGDKAGAGDAQRERGQRVPPRCSTLTNAVFEFKGVRAFAEEQDARPARLSCFASRSVRRPLLMPQVNPGSLYRAARRERLAMAGGKGPDSHGRRRKGA